jgi:hypothetical protein
MMLLLETSMGAFLEMGPGSEEMDLMDLWTGRGRESEVERL